MNCDKLLFHMNSFEGLLRGGIDGKTEDTT